MLEDHQPAGPAAPQSPAGLPASPPPADAGAAPATVPAPDHAAGRKGRRPERLDPGHAGPGGGSDDDHHGGQSAEGPVCRALARLAGAQGKARRAGPEAGPDRPGRRRVGAGCRRQRRAHLSRCRGSCPGRPPDHRAVFRRVVVGVLEAAPCARSGSRPHPRGSADGNRGGRAPVAHDVLDRQPDSQEDQHIRSGRHRAGRAAVGLHPRADHGGIGWAQRRPLLPPREPHWPGRPRAISLA